MARSDTSNDTSSDTPRPQPDTQVTGARRARDPDTDTAAGTTPRTFPGTLTRIRGGARAAIVVILGASASGFAIAAYLVWPRDLPALVERFERVETGLRQARAQINAVPRDIPGKLEATLERQGARMADIAARLTALEGLAAPHTGQGTAAALADLRAQLAAQQARTQALTERLEQIASHRAGKTGQEAGTAQDIALEQGTGQGTGAAPRTPLADRAAPRTPPPDSTAPTQAAQAAARDLLRIALRTGAPFVSALETLDPPLPRDVAAAAGQGIPTAESLQRAFAPLARAALVRTRAQTAQAAPVTDGTQSIRARISALVKERLRVRSLTPREGSDPDAVLSRAQAAANADDFAAAVGALDTLPQTAQDIFADWRRGARLRAEATRAIAAYIAQSRGAGE